MSKEELFSKLNNLLKVDNKSVSVYNDILKTIKQLEQQKLTNEEKTKVKTFKCDAQIGIVKQKLDLLKPEDYEKSIYLRGKLIELYKYKENIVQDVNSKMEARLRSIEELKNQRATLKTYKGDRRVKLPIDKKLGLTIKDISNSTELFMREKDVIKKAQNTVKSTVIGVAGAAAIAIGGSLLWSKIFNTDFNWDSVMSVAPTAAYIGLSSLIRNVYSKTEFEMYQYMNSEEYKFLVQSFNEKHEKELKEIGAVLEGKLKVRDKEALIKINNDLMEKFRALINQTEVEGLKDTFKLQILDLLRENKDICEEIKDDYEEERNNDKQKYIANNKRLAKINREIFVLGNSIKEALSFCKDSTIKSAKIIVIAKALLNAISPRHFAIGGLKALASPILIAAANNIIDIPTYHNKLKFKPTPYTGKVKMREKQKIEEIIGNDSYARAYA